MVDRDGRWQQADTPCSLISAPQWPHAPYSGPTWFSSVGKRPPVKADLAIYSPVNGVYVQCLSLAFMLSYNLDFNSCAIRDGFRKSSHILQVY